MNQVEKHGNSAISEIHPNKNGAEKKAQKGSQKGPQIGPFLLKQLYFFKSPWASQITAFEENEKTVLASAQKSNFRN